jgi:5'-nucleotidase
LLGLQGVAFSTSVDDGDPDLCSLKPFVKEVLDLLISKTDLVLVNVDLPKNPAAIRWARQSVRQ